VLGLRASATPQRLAALGQGYKNQLNNSFYSLSNLEESMPKKKSEKKKQSYNEKQAAKKAAVLAAGKKENKILPLVIIPAGIFILVIAGVYIFNQLGRPKAVAYGKEIVQPVSLFEDGKARHFQLDTKDGLTIKYFVIKSSDGVIRAAFDACDVCWPSGKGYVQKGDYMVCRNCGKRFASIKVNVLRGGCNPAPLTRKVVGDNLVIQVKDILEEGSKYFDFSRRRGV
jgi:uncharacterized membrane protein